MGAGRGEAWDELLSGKERESQSLNEFHVC